LNTKKLAVMYFHLFYVYLRVITRIFNDIKMKIFGKAEILWTPIDCAVFPGP